MNTFNEIIKLVKASKSTVILTGAGISTESGLPDFRSDNGFWTKNQPIQFNEFLLSEEKQRLSWERNIELHSLLENIKPNLGHMFVEKITSFQKNNFLITQNIDGLHQKSGVPKNKIIEIHGSAIEAACLECKAKQNISDFHDAIKFEGPLPQCTVCGGVVKVATISFGQPMNEMDMMHASKIVQESDLMIVMGSSLKVLPAGKLPNLAMQSGSKLIILNREKTRYDQGADIVINDELQNICSKLIDEL
ncbi:Sir2 family NAD-dependent protein deacetylase [Gammaproteobacteria bacterium]|nr:Sir2 family NAD-dependent protein deacetylase [Gammaproteobacteria bacterium]MDC0914575.1 Sir2 family NAD-dependent protein deacetylase [Gammaproteobacteria bacterium]